MFLSWLVLVVSLTGQSSSVPFPTMDTALKTDESLNGTQDDLSTSHAPYSDEVVWNPDTETAQQLQGRLCPERCNGTQKVNDVWGTRCSRCFPCACHKFCHVYGTCCPPLGQDTWTLPDLARAECQKSDDGVWTFRVVACHRSYPNNQTRALCESKSRPTRQDTELPVTAYQTGVTYANIHCALCNADYSKMAVWTMSCLHNQYLYDVTNDTQYEDRAILLPEVCSAVLKAPVPNRTYEHSCNSLRSRYHPPADLISRCNVTGRWEEEKGHLRKMCEDSDWSKGAVVIVDNAWIYANVFCAMCNEAPRTLAPSCISSSGPGHHVIEYMDNFVTHTQLIGRTDYGQEKVSVTSLGATECPDKQWKHPKKGCQRLQCSKGKVPRTGIQRCRTPVDRVRGLGYHLRILLQPILLTYQETQPILLTTQETQPILLTTQETHSPTMPPESATSDTPLLPFGQNASQFRNVAEKNSCDYAAAIRSEMESVVWLPFDTSAIITTAGRPDNASFCQAYQTQLQKLMEEGNVSGGTTDRTVLQWEREIGEDVRPLASFLEAVVEMNLIASTQNSRDTFEDMILMSVFSRNWTVHLDGWTVTLRARDLTSGLFEGNDKPAAEAFEVSRRHFSYERQWIKEHPLNGLEPMFLPLSRLLLCQYVSFDEDEFEVEVSEGTVHVRFPHFLDPDLQPVFFDVRDYPSEVQLGGNGKLLMCFTTYLQVFPANVTFVQPGREVSLARQVISLVCSSISVVCLVLTFLTYSLFSELRSLPGLNNMGLCFTLAAAHLILLLPWLRDSVSKQVCVWVGVGTHWLWLMALSWMSVGCVHMVRVFISKTRHALSQQGKKKAFLHNVLFTAVLSTGIVLLTVTISAVVSRGSSIGYGGRLCFFDTGLYPLLILAFLLPLGMMVMTNLVCFIITVIAIMRVRRLQAQAPGRRRDILVYAKLATVTGGGWLLALLADASGQEWMLVLAELCTASQGLLLFLSYVCNLRVWRLYRARFGPCGAQSAPTSTTLTAVTMTSGTKGPHTEV